MSKSISELSPQIVWKHFLAMCSIPHKSKHEEKIREYVVNFAAENSIECLIDEVGNVLLRKPATPGMEDAKGIIMQGHLDMVAQKNSDKDFDFLTDPIETLIDGEWVTANGTTLGADNGMGVAAALAIMESTDLVHGDIEALLTIDEEAGMTGAFALQPNFLKGDILLNLDSETEGEIYVGCAGGSDAVAKFPVTWAKPEAGAVSYMVVLKGMKGGHSGVEINLQRANANKALVRVLYEAAAVANFNLASFNGGDVRNAIPRECTATVAVNSGDVASFEKQIAASVADISKELEATEGAIELVVTKIDALTEVYDNATTTKFLQIVMAHPNGVIRMSDSLEGLVETSLNLGVVTSGKDAIELISLIRSSSTTAKHTLCDSMKSFYDLAGVESEFGGNYGGWIPNMNSDILKVLLTRYEALYGTVPAITAIHAGLECGIFAEPYPNLDMISFGPTIRFPHSPDEKVHIESVAKFYEFLKDILANAPKK